MLNHQEEFLVTGLERQVLIEWLRITKHVFRMATSNSVNRLWFTRQKEKSSLIKLAPVCCKTHIYQSVIIYFLESYYGTTSIFWGNSLSLSLYGYLDSFPQSSNRYVYLYNVKIGNLHIILISSLNLMVISQPESCDLLVTLQVLLRWLTTESSENLLFWSFKHFFVINTGILQKYIWCSSP